MEIYNNKSKFKLGFVSIALILGFLSLYYTSTLVNRLAQRERKLIDLYAKGLEFALNPEIGDGLTFLQTQIIEANDFVPVILFDETQDTITGHRNILQKDIDTSQKALRRLEKELKTMRTEHTPIRIKFNEIGIDNSIYYRDSDLLGQLRYYPYMQLLVITVFGFLTYLTFSYSRRAEQNRVWVGMAKETAHQLGTPISSLMAWLEYLKMEEALEQDDILIEIEKDIRRLQMVTERFSNIGSKPNFKQEDIYFIILGITNYLKRRISNRIRLEVKADITKGTTLLMNRHLFEWVIENICKNAADALGAKKDGKIMINLNELPEGDIKITIEDNGKGMSKKQVKKVFNPGFTTKKRGWGLGLTLAKRIIENYHQGKITVEYSEPNQGTRFVILLRNKFEEEESKPFMEKN